MSACVCIFCVCVHIDMEKCAELYLFAATMQKQRTLTSRNHIAASLTMRMKKFLAPMMTNRKILKITAKVEMIAMIVSKTAVVLNGARLQCQCSALSSFKFVTFVTSSFRSFPCHVF